MESTRWNLLDGIYTMEYTQWNPHHRIYTMESTRWNLHDGIYTMEYTQWNPHHRIYTMDGIYTMESTRWNLHDGIHDGIHTMESTRWMESTQWNLHDGNYTIESTRWNLHNGIHTMRSSASLIFSVAFEHHIFSHLPCIGALFLSPSLSDISFPRYARPFVPPIFSGALQRTPFAPAAPAALQGDTPPKDAPKPATASTTVQPESFASGEDLRWENRSFEDCSA